MLDRALTFRDAREADAADLSEIGRETFSETFGHLYSASDLRDYLDENFAIDRMREETRDPEIDIRICLSGRGMVAFCKIGPMKLPVDTGSEPVLELHRIYVFKSRQGVGVGRILLTWAIDRARQRRAKALYLGVWEGNDRARAVYASRGFEAVGAYKFRVGQTLDDEVIMRLAL